MERHDEENLYVRQYRNGGGGGGSSASSISYDDSQTGLHAVNVQEAIEALDAVCDNNAQRIETLAANKQDKLQAGAGVTIENNVISATGSGVVAEYNAANENLSLI